MTVDRQRHRLFGGAREWKLTGLTGALIGLFLLAVWAIIRLTDSAPLITP